MLGGFCVFITIHGKALPKVTFNNQQQGELMADYEILKNRLNDFKYITFTGDTMPKRLIIDRTQYIRKGGKYKFKAMRMSNGEINVFVMDKYFDHNQQLLKRIEPGEPVGAEDFETIYRIAMDWLNS